MTGRPSRASRAVARPMAAAWGTRGRRASAARRACRSASSPTCDQAWPGSCTATAAPGRAAAMPA
ncbi:hypothetical protein DCC79_12140, partial [bacterium]